MYDLCILRSRVVDEMSQNARARRKSAGTFRFATAHTNISLFFVMPVSVALRRSAALRRLLSSHGARTYHASSLACDALDMADTFSRRHRKFRPRPRPIESKLSFGHGAGFGTSDLHGLGLNVHRWTKIPVVLTCNDSKSTSRVVY